MTTKKIIILYVEGETEEEFYNRLKEHLQDKGHSKKSTTYILKVVCVKSITRFSSKLLNKFKNEAAIKYPKNEKVVFLCYDSDGFEFGMHPAINRKKLEKELIDAGANKVKHIVADKTIEDYLMVDKENILKFLKLNIDTKIKGKTGFEKMKYIFSKAGKTYFKGKKTGGLIDMLNMEKICNKMCPQLSELCFEIKSECSKCKKSQK